jgi:hypothetical protein
VRALLLLLLALSGCQRDPCADLLCRYDDADAGVCHTGPAACCGEAPPQTEQGGRDACGGTGRLVGRSDAGNCLADQSYHSGCG